MSNLFSPTPEHQAASYVQLNKDKEVLVRRELVLFQQDLAFGLAEIMREYNLKEARFLLDQNSSITLESGLKVPTGYWFDIQDRETDIFFTGYQDKLNMDAAERFAQRLSPSSPYSGALQAFNKLCVALPDMYGEQLFLLNRTLAPMKLKSFGPELPSIMSVVMDKKTYPQWLSHYEAYELSQNIQKSDKIKTLTQKI